MRRIAKPYIVISLSIINLLIYVLVLNGFIKYARQTIFYFTGIYITSGIVLLTILFMIIKKKYGLSYWLILIINTLVFVWAYLYLQDALRLK